jgi:hypothetical protein
MSCQPISLHLPGSALTGSPVHRVAVKKTPMRACPSGLALAGGAQQAEAGAGQFCFEAAAEVVLVADDDLPSAAGG